MIDFLVFLLSFMVGYSLVKFLFKGTDAECCLGGLIFVLLVHQQ